MTKNLNNEGPSYEEIQFKMKRKYPKKQLNLDIPVTTSRMFDMIKINTNKGKTDYLINWIINEFKKQFPDLSLKIDDIEILFTSKTDLKKMQHEIQELQEKGIIFDEELISSLTVKHSGYSFKELGG